MHQMVANSLKLFHQRNEYTHTKIFIARNLNHNKYNSSIFMFFFRWKYSIFNPPKRDHVLYRCSFVFISLTIHSIVYLYECAVMCLYEWLCIQYIYVCRSSWWCASTLTAHNFASAAAAAEPSTKSNRIECILEFFLSFYFCFSSSFLRVHTTYYFFILLYRLACRQATTHYYVCETSEITMVHNDQFYIERSVSLVFKCYLPIEVHR